MPLPPHRRLIWFLETALACLDETVAADDRLGVLPHWAKSDLRRMAAEIQDLLERVGRESPAGFFGDLEKFRALESLALTK